MPYKGKRKFRFSRNLLSAEEIIQISKEQIYKEIMSGRVAGPFENSPFSQISSLGLVPKKKPGEIRVIHHLSNQKEPQLIMESLKICVQFNIKQLMMLLN